MEAGGPIPRQSGGAERKTRGDEREKHQQRSVRVEEEQQEQEYPDGIEPESDEESEDVYVVVQLPRGVDPQAFSTSAASVKGIGTGSPRLKIGDETFKGKTNPIVGTSLVFRTPPAGSSGGEPLRFECYSNMQMGFEHPGHRKSKKSDKER